MSELRIDRLVPNEPHRQLREFFLYGQPKPDTAVALAVAEPLPPDQSSVLDAADPVARLEHCVNLQARAISLLGGNHYVQLEHNTELLALLKEAISHERALMQGAHL